MQMRSIPRWLLPAALCVGAGALWLGLQFSSILKVDITHRDQSSQITQASAVPGATLPRRQDGLGTDKVDDSTALDASATSIVTRSDSVDKVSRRTATAGAHVNEVDPKRQSIEEDGLSVPENGPFPVSESI